jgi:hypothetical protein
MRVSLAGVATVSVATCLAVGVIGVRPALADSDPVVRPGHLHGWYLTTNKTVNVLYDSGNLNKSSSATYRFRFGPGRPPLGKGSLLMSVGDVPNSRVAAVPPGLTGELKALHSVSYETYLTKVGGSPLPTSFKLAVTSAKLGYFTTLVYEPDRQPSPKAKARRWQTWHPLTGLWWASHVTGECSQSQPCSWHRMKHLVGEKSTLYGAYFELGDSSGDYEGIACALDKVIINGTVYNLEPTPRPRHHRPALGYCRAAVHHGRTTVTSAAC